MMKTIFTLTLFCIVKLAIVQAQSQVLSSDSLPYDFKCVVKEIDPPLSITKQNLVDANTLIDLYKHYKRSWIREYVSVAVIASNNGKRITVKSKNDTLSQAQKDIMYAADNGSEITVNVRYKPDSNLTINDIKSIDFSFKVNPEEDAQFPGGQKQLQQYLKDNILDKVALSTFKQYQLTAIKFAINEKGDVVDVHVFQSSDDKKVDALLVNAICNMPKWTPAIYSNGFKEKQEFALTVGDMYSCVLNLLNVRDNVLLEADEEIIK